MPVAAARLLERAILVTIGTLLSLLAFGWFLAHETAPWPAAAVLLGCAWFTRLVLRWPSLGASTAPIAGWIGIVAALLFVPGIWIEYLGRTVDNRVLYGAVLSLWTLAGVLAARASGRVRDAMIASTLSAIFSTAVFLVAVMAPYYLLRGSALQDVFFRAEGTYDDFQRSGMRDLTTFVIDDMFGGAFIHSLFGALVACSLGAAGGTVVATILRLRRRRESA